MKDDGPSNEPEASDENRIWLRRKRLGILVAIVVLCSVYWIFFLNRSLEDSRPCGYLYVQADRNCKVSSDECNYWQSAYEQCMESLAMQKSKKDNDALLQEQYRQDQEIKIRDHLNARMKKFQNCMDQPQPQDRQVCLDNLAIPEDIDRGE
jgi:hypothetical protein